MTESCQGEGITLACEYRIQDIETADSGDVVQNAIILEIHWVEGLSHMQDVLCRHLDQAAAMSPK